MIDKIKMNEMDRKLERQRKRRKNSFIFFISTVVVLILSICIGSVIIYGVFYYQNNYQETQDNIGLVGDVKIVGADETIILYRIFDKEKDRDCYVALHKRSSLNDVIDGVDTACYDTER